MPLAVRTLPVAVMGAAALLGLLAVIDPLVAVAGSVGIAFGILMLADVTVGLCIFAFSAALFEAIPEFGAFSVAKALGLALALSWFAALTVRPTLRGEVFSEMPGYTVLLLLLVAWGGVSVLWAEDSSLTIAAWTRLLLNVLLIPIAFSAVRNMRALRWVAAALLAGMVLSAMYGYVINPGAVDVEGRLGGAGLDPNYLALWLVIAATLGLGTAAHRATEPALRWSLAIGAGICLLAALATASRTGLVALATVLVFAPLVAGRGRRAAMTLLAVIAVAGTGLYITSFASDAVREHISETQGGGSGRTDIWKVGARMARANPVLGVGLGNFQTSSVHYLLEPGTITRSDYIVDQPKVAHNTYLELAAETGGVGLALYVVIALVAVASGVRAAGRFTEAGRRDESLMARAVVLATLAALAGSTFISLQYTKPLWLLLALGPITLHLSRQERA
jgi:putative inorganic carbon (HCO3(-)) transporter